MNIVAAGGTDAEKVYRDWAAVPEARVPGLPATPSHDLIYHGGKTIPSLTFTNFYAGGQAAWQPSDIQSIDQALAAAMSDQNLNNVMVQYFPGTQITSAFQLSSILPGTPPSLVNKTDVETIISTLVTNGRLGGFDLATSVFNIMLPSGTVLTDESAASSPGTPPAGHGHHRPHRGAATPKDAVDSLHGLGGYHGSVHIGQETIYYAVGVYSEQRPDGTRNGIPVFDMPWKNVVATFYHELNEARTDADVEDAIRAGNGSNSLGWVSRQGEECGDFPISEARTLTQVFGEVQLADGSGSVPVQFMYSNAVHGPEGPIAKPH